MMRLTPSKVLLVATAVAIVAMGSYFVFMRPPLLPEDLRYIGVTQESLQAVAPKLAQWLSLVFRVMGGFITATGLLLLSISMTCDLSRRPLALLAVGCAAFASIVVMTTVNFMLDSDFKWVILAIAGLWAFGLAAQFVSVKPQVTDRP